MTCLRRMEAKGRRKRSRRRGGKGKRNKKEIRKKMGGILNPSNGLTSASFFPLRVDKYGSRLQ